MSTEVQPPSPPPEVTTGSRYPATSAGGKLSKKPPTTFESRSLRRQHRRSSSLGELFSRMMPSNRPEKGHTLRPDIAVQYTHTNSNARSNDSSFGRVANETNSNCDFARGYTPHNNAYLPPRRADHQAAEQQKKGAMKRLIGSMQSTKNAARAIIRKSAEEHVEKPTASQSEDTDFHGIISQQLLNIDNKQSRSNPSQPRQPYAISSAVRRISKEKEVAALQQVLVHMKSRQVQQRRTLRESGDFLGVQGANPSTGYWDSTEGTTSSEETNQLAKRALELEQQKREIAEAELEIQAREQEKKDYKLQKRRPRNGRWQRSDCAWNSVAAESALSPIEQSVSGSSILEVLEDFPKPSAYTLFPNTNARSVKQEDRQHIIPKRTSSLDRSGSRTSRRNSSDASQYPVPARRSSLKEKEGSTSTIIHGTAVPSPLNNLYVGNYHENKHLSRPETEPIQAREQHGLPAEGSTLDVKHLPFLGQMIPVIEPPGKQESKAIAISYRSASMSQLQTHQSSDQNLRAGSPTKRITSLKDLPPVFIKDPIAARNPLSFQFPRTNFPIRSPPTKVETQLGQQPSCTSTFIITITGPGPHQQTLHTQLDGANDTTNVAQATGPASPHKLRRSPRKESLREPQSHESQITQVVNIVTSSEHQLTPVKQRITTLHPAASAEVGHTATAAGVKKIELKNIPISTSTSPRSPPREQDTAHNAARLAFIHTGQLPAQDLWEKTNGNASQERLKVAKQPVLGDSGIPPPAAAETSACASVSAVAVAVACTPDRPPEPYFGRNPHKPFTKEELKIALRPKLIALGFRPRASAATPAQHLSGSDIATARNAHYPDRLPPAESLGKSTDSSGGGGDCSSKTMSKKEEFKARLFSHLTARASATVRADSSSSISSSAFALAHTPDAADRLLVQHPEPKADVTVVEVEVEGVEIEKNKLKAGTAAAADGKSIGSDSRARPSGFSASPSAGGPPSAGPPSAPPSPLGLGLERARALVRAPSAALSLVLAPRGTSTSTYTTTALLIPAPAPASAVLLGPVTRHAHAHRHGTDAHAHAHAHPTLPSSPSSPPPPPQPASPARLAPRPLGPHYRHRRPIEQHVRVPTRQVLFFMVTRVVDHAWTLVKPAFDPRSPLRMRFRLRDLTFLDHVVLVAAFFFLAISVFAISMLLKIAGVALCILNALTNIVRFLI